MTTNGLAEPPDSTVDDDVEVEVVYQLVYASRAVRPFSEDDLVELLRRSRNKNDRLDVTGMLLYHDGSFIQALEGECETVEALYEVIAADERHDDALLLHRGEQLGRSFEGWSMGYEQVGRVSPPLPEGFNRFLQTGALGLRADDGNLVRRVLIGFRDGKYRRV